MGKKGVKTCLSSFNSQILGVGENRLLEGSKCSILDFLMYVISRTLKEGSKAGKKGGESLIKGILRKGRGTVRKKRGRTEKG